MRENSARQPWLPRFVFRGILARGLLFCWALSFPLPQGNAAAEESLSRQAALSAGEKLRRIQQGALAERSARSVRVSEAEANSYLHYEAAPRLPPGLSDLSLRFSANRIRGTAEVDFDKAKEAAGRPSGSVLDYLFWGVHTLAVEGVLSGANGMGRFVLESVSLDGVVLPRPLVDLLMERYLKRRFPTIDLDRPFLLPYSIDRVQVEPGSVLLAGRPRESV